MGDADAEPEFPPRRALFSRASFPRAAGGALGPAGRDRREAAADHAVELPYPSGRRRPAQLLAPFIQQAADQRRPSRLRPHRFLLLGYPAISKRETPYRRVEFPKRGGDMATLAFAISAIKGIEWLHSMPFIGLTSYFLVTNPSRSIRVPLDEVFFVPAGFTTTV